MPAGSGPYNGYAYNLLWWVWSCNEIVIYESKEKHVKEQIIFKISSLVGSETGNAKMKFIHKIFLGTVRSVLCILSSTPGMMQHLLDRSYWYYRIQDDAKIWAPCVRPNTAAWLVYSLISICGGSWLIVDYLSPRQGPEFLINLIIYFNCLIFLPWILY